MIKLKSEFRNLYNFGFSYAFYKILFKLKEVVFADSDAVKKEKKEFFKNKFSIKLYMTLLAKNDQDIIREHILFHKSMGVDGFIVTVNNSTDNTVKILNELKKSGIKIDILFEPEKNFFQDVWVDRMIKIAKNKHKADWVINADSDEFWYSNNFDLKIDINKSAVGNVNVLYTFLTNFYPVENKEDFFNSCYFIKRPLNKIEAKRFNINTKRFGESVFRRKVIHKLKGYKKIGMGNHRVKMKNYKEAYLCDTTIYHYIIKNYSHFGRKSIEGGMAIKDAIKDDAIGEHWHRWYSAYLDGRLYDEYKNEFGLEYFDYFLKNGVVVPDTSLLQYLRYSGILL